MTGFEVTTFGPAFTTVLSIDVEIGASTGCLTEGFGSFAGVGSNGSCVGTTAHDKRNPAKGQTKIQKPATHSTKTSNTNPLKHKLFFIGQDVAGEWKSQMLKHKETKGESGKYNDDLKEGTLFPENGRQQLR